MPLALRTHSTYLSTRSDKDHQIDSGVCLLTAVDRSFYSRSLHLYPSHDVVDTEDVCTGMGPQEVGLSERPVEKCFYLFFCSFIWAVRTSCDQLVTGNTVDSFGIEIIFDNQAIFFATSFFVSHSGGPFLLNWCQPDTSVAGQTKYSAKPRGGTSLGTGSKAQAQKWGSYGVR